jgi:hypothetical protein
VKRYLFRVQYTFSDGTQSYELVCVRDADNNEAGARVQVSDATSRYKTLMGATTTSTLLGVAVDA